MAMNKLFTINFAPVTVKNGDTMNFTIRVTEVGEFTVKEILVNGEGADHGAIEQEPTIKRLPAPVVPKQEEEWICL